MANTSADIGYLQPDPPIVPSLDNDFIDVIQEMVCGITGIDGHLLFPRWQNNPPTMPEYNVTWGALGFSEAHSDVFAAIIHDSNNEGRDILFRQVEIDVTVTFYGPNSGLYMAMLRDGLQIAQNREVMYSHGMAFVESSHVTANSELVNQRWTSRYDIVITIRRMVILTYNVQNLLSSQGTVTTGEYQTQFDTETLSTGKVT
jgi:hypothetical protein